DQGNEVVTGPLEVLELLLRCASLVVSEDRVPPEGNDDHLPCPRPRRPLPLHAHRSLSSSAIISASPPAGGRQATCPTPPPWSRLLAANSATPTLITFGPVVSSSFTLPAIAPSLYPTRYDRRGRARRIHRRPEDDRPGSLELPGLLLETLDVVIRPADRRHH